MKQSLVLFLIVASTTFATTQKQIVKASDAKKYVGKEIVVCGRLCGFANSSYVQTAWYYLGRDTAHKELTVIVHGRIYGVGNTWIGKYVGKKVLIKGIVRNNDGLFLEATDTVRSR